MQIRRIEIEREGWSIAGAVRFAGCFECMHFSARLASNGQGFVFCCDARASSASNCSDHCVAWVNGALLADAFVFFVLNDSEGIEVLDAPVSQEKRRARKMTRMMLPHLHNLN